MQLLPWSASGSLSNLLTWTHLLQSLVHFEIVVKWISIAIYTVLYLFHLLLKVTLQIAGLAIYEPEFLWPTAKLYRGDTSSIIWYRKLVPETCVLFGAHFWYQFLN